MLKSQATDWEKTVSKHKSDKGLVSRICFKNSQNSIRNNPIFKKWTKDSNVSPEKIYEEQMSTWKDARCHHLSGRCAVKAQGDPSASARMAGSARGGLALPGVWGSGNCHRAGASASGRSLALPSKGEHTSGTRRLCSLGTRQPGPHRDSRVNVHIGAIRNHRWTRPERLQAGAWRHSRGTDAGQWKGGRC